MTSSFFDSQPAKPPGMLSTADRFQVERDQWGRRMLPNAEGKMVPWTGVTTIARVLEDEYNIYQWKLCQAAWGQAHSPHLIALAGAAAKDDRKTLKQVVEKSLEIASDHKADLGNALHNILARFDAGLEMDDVPEYFRPLVLAYRRELDHHGWELLPDFVERAIVCNRYNIDGIGDRWVQRTSDGMIAYMDIKTGDDPGKYPHKPTIQLALCANADAAIDHATGAQVSMPPVCKDFALVMHIDPTSGEAKLLRNDDIMLGWAAVRIAYEARAWRRTEIVFHPYISEANWQPKSTMTLDTSKAGIVTFDTSQYWQPGPIAVIDPHVPAAHETRNGQTAGFTPPIDPDTEIEELLKEHKTKPPLVELCTQLGITDVKHHRRDLATLIVKKRNELRANGVKIESLKSNGGESTAAPHPSSDPNTAKVIDAIRIAASMNELRDIHKGWTEMYGPDAWSGEVLAAGHRRMTELRTVNH